MLYMYHSRGYFQDFFYWLLIEYEFEWFVLVLISCNNLLVDELKYSKREYRAIASWHHLICFEFRTKVHSEKGIIQYVDSSFGANLDGGIVLVYVHGQKILLFHIPFYYIWVWTVIVFAFNIFVSILYIICMNILNHTLLFKSGQVL